MWFVYVVNDKSKRVIKGKDTTEVQRITTKDSKNIREPREVVKFITGL